MGNGCTLVSKTLGQNFAKYTGKAPRLSSKIPHTVDNVVAHINGIRKEITTFRDSKGNIIERSFFNGKKYKNRLYERYYNTIGDDEFVTSTAIKEYTLPKNMLEKYYFILKDFKAQNIASNTLWNQIQVTINHSSENLRSGETILSQTKIKDDKHTITEFPHIIKNKLEKGTKKFIEFVVNKRTLQPKAETIISEGAKFPKNDSYIAYRTMETADMRKPITERFITERKLQDTDIHVNTEYEAEGLPKGQRLLAIFSAEDGIVNFNKKYKFLSKSKLVRISRHEVEHAWQYYLDARYTKGGYSIWQFERYLIDGEIKSPLLKQEAKRYSDSIRNYVKYTEDFAKYKQNYIEVKADEAGEKAFQAYESQGEQVRKEFPHIPKELL